MTFKIGTSSSLALVRFVIVALSVALPAALWAEPDGAAVRKLLTMIGAVGEEYREAIEDGRVARPVEYEESLAFLADSRTRLADLGLDAPVVAELDAVASDLEARIRAVDDVETVTARVAVMRAGLAKAAGVAADVYPSAPPSMARGRALFGEYCAGCHGVDGDGKGPDAVRLHPLPANFRDRDFMSQETPYDFFHVISLGRRNTAMPAWDEALSPQERWDLVSFLWSFGEGETGIGEGQGLYQAHCASCHGSSGDGRGVLAGKLVSPPKDLSRIEALARRPNIELFQVVSHGVAGSPMVGFGTLLDEEQRWKVVAYVRLLSMGGWSDAVSELDPVGESTRFRGLLTMLERARGDAADAAPDATVTEWIEVDAIAAQVAAHAPVVEQRLATVAPSAAASVRKQTDELVRLVQDRASLADLATVANRLRLLILEHFPEATPAVPEVESGVLSPSDALLASRRFLAQALAAYEKGDPAAAALVSDAYFEFEPLERHLGGVAPGLKADVEARFLRLRQELRKSNNTTSVRGLMDEIDTYFVDAERALQPRTQAWGVVAQSAGIILREGFEVILVIGALAAYVARSGQVQMRRFLYAGTSLGIGVSLLTAYALEEVLRRNPGSADMLEGFTMLLAAIVLFWVSYWLISKAEADRWQQYIKGKVQHALSTGSGLALAGTAFLAVYREGFETILFYKALYAGAPGHGSLISLGLLIGGLLLALLYVAFRRFQARLPMKQFFLVTGAFLYAMAAIFAGQGIKELQEVGLVSDTHVGGVPTLPLLGIFPSVETLIGQAVFLALLLFALMTIRRRARRVS